MKIILQPVPILLGSLVFACIACTDPAPPKTSTDTPESGGGIATENINENEVTIPSQAGMDTPMVNPIEPS